MLVGYARISTGEQNLDLQTDVLKQAGCAKVFTDQMSGAKAERSGLQAAFAFVHTSDTLIVWRLERLGRSLKDLVQKVEDLQQRRVGLRSLHESIDTIVHDLVNLVGAVRGYGQPRGGQGLAQAVAGDVGAMLMGYDEDVGSGCRQLPRRGRRQPILAAYRGSTVGARRSTNIGVYPHLDSKCRQTPAQSL